MGIGFVGVQRQRMVERHGRQQSARGDQRHRQGTWKKSATGAYVAELRFWRYLPDGSPAGQHRLTRTITLAADGKSLTSTITTQALDASDNMMQSACGAETGVRAG